VQWTQSAPLKRADDCPGYTASNVENTDGGITADLTLAGAACNVYGTDLHDLKFEASYQTGEPVHGSYVLLAIHRFDVTKAVSRPG
jgi:alpha-glucosidase